MKGTGSGSDAHLIEVRLRNINALFNSMDPSPFHEKDLDAAAEDFIVGWALKFPLGDRVALQVQLEEWPGDESATSIPAAVRHHFAYRTELIGREFSQLMRQARGSLAIGLSFLALCLLTSHYLLGDMEQAWAKILRESLSIAGWVAMWRPMELYLYDWWPLRHRRKLYEKLSRMQVDVVRRN
ncbi:MAG: hypothetical protein JNM31_06610 [Flavobacteriales bacterium]|nr:hypothetical protein [Flavobacteriales bacterium]